MRLSDKLWAEAQKESARTIFGMVLGALVTAFFSWAASTFEPISRHGTGAIILAGAIVACLIIFAVSALLIAWRYYRPLVPSPQKEEIDSGDTLGVFRRSFEGKLSDLTTTAVNLAKDSDARISALEERLAGKIKAVDTRLEQTANSIRYENSMLAERTFALKTVYEMHKFKREIDRQIVRLELPLKQPKSQRDWRGWQDNFRKFQRAMALYENAAARFYPKEAPNLTFVRPDVYRLSIDDFAPDNFPNNEMAFDFKTFRSMSVSFKEIGSDLMQRIEGKT